MNSFRVIDEIHILLILNAFMINRRKSLLTITNMYVRMLMIDINLLTITQQTHSSAQKQVDKVA